MKSLLINLQTRVRVRVFITHVQVPVRVLNLNLTRQKSTENILVSKTNDGTI